MLSLFFILTSASPRQSSYNNGRKTKRSLGSISIISGLPLLFQSSSSSSSMDSLSNESRVKAVFKPPNPPPTMHILFLRCCWCCSFGIFSFFCRLEKLLMLSIFGEILSNKVKDFRVLVDCWCWCCCCCCCRCCNDDILVVDNNVYDVDECRMEKRKIQQLERRKVVLLWTIILIL